MSTRDPDGVTTCGVPATRSELLEDIVGCGHDAMHARGELGHEHRRITLRGELGQRHVGPRVELHLHRLRIIEYEWSGGSTSRRLWASTVL